MPGIARGLKVPADSGAKISKSAPQVTPIATHVISAVMAASGHPREWHKRAKGVGQHAGEAQGAQG